jgi:hypothetical protein
MGNTVRPAQANSQSAIRSSPWISIHASDCLRGSPMARISCCATQITDRDDVCLADRANVLFLQSDHGLGTA